ncbi:hypothetical protein [Pseudomonas sp.]|uniref:hypothetical protein n=1 Tax=Pseudomonas sp. TaxID=306 RepID=UPI003F380D60
MASEAAGDAKSEFQVRDLRAKAWLGLSNTPEIAGQESLSDQVNRDQLQNSGPEAIKGLHQLSSANP